MGTWIFGIIIGAVVISTVIFFISIRDKGKKNKDTSYADGLDQIIRGDHQLAAKYLRTAVKKNSSHINAYIHLGNILIDTHPEQAIKIHQSLTVRPRLNKDQKFDIHKTLAQDYFKTGNYRAAKRELERILLLEKRNIWATRLQMEIAENETDWETAIQQAKLYQRLTNKNQQFRIAGYYVNLGNKYLHESNYGDARNAFLKAIKSDKEYGLPHYYLGNVYEKERDLSKAISEWETFAMNSPKDSQMVFGKIETALFDLGRFSEVEKFYRRILDKEKDNLGALVKLANVMEEKGEHQIAINLVEEALSRDKHSIHAGLMKLKLSLQNTQPSKLSHQVDKIISHLPENEVS